MSTRIANGAAYGYSEAEVRAGQTLIDYRYPPSLGGYGYSLETAKSLMGYKTGGVVDYTGLAWLDGTPSRPEIVLNQKDSANFLQLKEILSKGLDKNSTSTDASNGDNYYNINIEVEKITDDYDVEQLAVKLKKIINEDARYRNVNAVNRLR